MLSVKEAQQKIIDTVATLEPVELNLADAVGKVLAEDIVSKLELPPFDNSAMDGFAVKISDVSTASAESPARLKVVLDLAAGSYSEQELKPGEAARIMTGAPVPRGAEGVVRVEDTDYEDGWVIVKTAIKPKANIRFQGEDIALGATVLKAGRRLMPGDIGLAAAIGKNKLRVHPSPRVAIISTGDEIEDPGTELGPGQIYNSNAYMLSALLKYHGFEPVFIGIARDRREELESKLKEATQYDLILTSGGVSVGVYDLVKEVLSQMGTMFFWKVALRPGKPLAFGLVQGVPLLGLPGNPGSSFVNFYQFVLTALRKLAGWREVVPPKTQAVMGEELKKKKGLTYCARASLTQEDGKLVARLSGGQSSGMLGSLALAEALVIIGEDIEMVREGDAVQVQLLY